VRRVARSEPVAYTVHLAHRCAYVARMRPAPSDFLRGARAFTGDRRWLARRGPKSPCDSRPPRRPGVRIWRDSSADPRRIARCPRCRSRSRTFHNIRDTIVSRMGFKHFATSDTSCAILRAYSCYIFPIALET